MRMGSMWRSWWPVALLLPVVVSCGDGPTAPPEALRMESEHFVFLATTASSSEGEMQEGLVRAEALFQRLGHLVGSEHTPEERIRVTLHGDLAGRGPYVDFDGVHLYRYSAEEAGYWAVLAHELVHAFAAEWFIDLEAWNWHTFRYFDEGFAEFAAQEIDPDKTGFPFYGFPEDVVVGHRVVAGEHIPPAVLRENHQALNQPCEVQSYPQRASWMRYVDETFGRDALLALVYPDEEPTDAVVYGITGTTLADIDMAWEAWVIERYAEFPGGAAIAEAYRARTSWARLCVEGVDW